MLKGDGVPGIPNAKTNGHSTHMRSNNIQTFKRSILGPETLVTFHFVGIGGCTGVTSKAMQQRCRLWVWQLEKGRQKVNSLAILHRGEKPAALFWILQSKPLNIGASSWRLGKSLKCYNKYHKTKFCLLVASVGYFHVQIIWFSALPGMHVKSQSALGSSRRRHKAGGRMLELMRECSGDHQVSVSIVQNE